MATQKKAGGQKRGPSRPSGSQRKSSPGNPTSRRAKASSSGTRSTATRGASSRRTAGAKSSSSTRKAPSDGKGALGSRAFERAKRAGRKVVADPAEARKLEQRAAKKASEHQDALGGALDDLRTLLRLIRAYSKKDYREVPKRTLVLAAGAVVYFVNLADLIPDVIPVIGYVDDVAVLLFVVDSISSDLDAFRAWERERDAASKKRPRPARAKSAETASKPTKKRPTASEAGAKGTANRATPKIRTTNKSATKKRKKPAKT